MASELRVNTLKDASRNNNVGMSTVANGSAKQWVLGSDAAVLTDSFNTSSGTDNGDGDYLYTFTSAMASANFTSHATGMQNARRYGFSEARTTTTNRLDFRDDNELSADCANSSAIHGTSHGKAAELAALIGSQTALSNWNQLSTVRCRWRSGVRVSQCYRKRISRL